MQVILLESIETLGPIGAIVKVADGFGRNYLLPRKKALRATKDNIAYFDKRREVIAQENLAKKDEALLTAQKLEGLVINIIRQAAEDGRLYGSVTARDITKAIFQTSSIEIAPDQVVLNHKFKAIGVYDVLLVLHADVKAKVGLHISRVEQDSI